MRVARNMNVDCVALHVRRRGLVEQRLDFDRQRPKVGHRRGRELVRRKDLREVVKGKRVVVSAWQLVAVLVLLHRVLVGEGLRLVVIEEPKQVLEPRHQQVHLHVDLFVEEVQVRQNELVRRLGVVLDGQRKVTVATVGLNVKGTNHRLGHLLRVRRPDLRRLALQHAVGKRLATPLFQGNVRVGVEFEPAARVHSLVVKEPNE